MRPVITKLWIRPLFADSGVKFPTLDERINEILALGRINMIIVDGKAQTGKSTLAREIAARRDKKYITIFRIEELIEYLKKARELWFSGNAAEVMNHWVFFDEPQLEAARQEYWSNRNLILQAFTSSFGFLHNHLIMALPNIKGLADNVLTNISLRMSVMSYIKDGKIVRKAYVKKPIFAERKNKFLWVTVQDFVIPHIEKDANYDDAKAHNFFDFQVKKWEDRMKGIKGGLQPPASWRPPNWVDV